MKASCFTRHDDTARPCVEPSEAESQRNELAKIVACIILRSTRSE